MAPGKFIVPLYMTAWSAVPCIFSMEVWFMPYASLHMAREALMDGPIVVEPALEAMALMISEALHANNLTQGSQQQTKRTERTW